MASPAKICQEQRTLLLSLKIGVSFGGVLNVNEK